MLCADLLDALVDVKVDAYHLVEKSPNLTSIQKEKVGHRSNVHWHQHCPKLDALTVVIANEVLDALSVRKVQLGTCPKEYYVSAKDDAFDWVLSPIECSALQSHLASIDLSPIEGYETEVNLNMNALIRELSDNIAHGVFLFFDYGFSQDEYYHPSRHMGTLMAHHRHHAHEHVLHNPGEQDITAHVDYSHLYRVGEQCGLELLGYTTQAHFLMACNIVEFAQDFRDSQQITMLTAPHEMGELFKVMAFGKGIAIDLMGFETKDLSYKL